MGGTGYEIGNSIAVDASGNIITAGTFGSTSDFNPGAGTTSIVPVSGYEAFITKHDNAGNLLWVKAIGGNGDQYAQSVALDASGNVYVTGYFTGTVDLDPGIAVASVSSAGNEDIFIVKLDVSGNYLWGNTIGSFSEDQAFGLHVDGSSNVYVAGNFRGTVDFDPSAGGTANLSGSIMDMFILKLNASGNYVWARDMGSNTPGNFVGARTVTTDASGNVLIGGFFQGTVVLDPGGTAAASTSAGDDGYILKLNSSGIYVWSKTLGSSGQDMINDLKTDASGNVYSTGYYFQSADFDPHPTNVYTVPGSSYDAFAWKLDASGNFVWAYGWGGVNGDYGNSLYLDASANVFITGYFSGTVDFDPGSGGSYPLSSNGFSDDAYILKLNTSGNFQMAIPVGGNDSEAGKSIKVDGAGLIYLTGSYLQTADFDPGLGTYNLTSAGSADIFIAKYSQTIILPVSLVNFSASLTSDKKVKLNWQTASEQNVSEFKIERSADGRNYSSIGSVTAAGNSASKKDYSFTDADPKPVNIYRIKTVDVDGKIQYSKTIMIRFNGSGAALTAFPNPVKDVLQLQTSMKGNLEVQVYNATGHLVNQSMYKNAASAFSFSLDLNRLNTGLYVVMVSNGTEMEKVSFIKD